MKTPEEIKKSLGPCSPENGFAPFYNNFSCKKKKWCANVGNVDALAYIRQLESNWKQVSKALCGKENATLEEVLQVVSQVKAELETVKRERDAAVDTLESIATGRESKCDHCVHKLDGCRSICWGTRWQWRGVCNENTEVQE